MSSFAMQSDGPVNRETVTTTKLTYRGYQAIPLKVQALDEGTAAIVQVCPIHIKQGSKADRDTLQRVIADLKKILEAL